MMDRRITGWLAWGALALVISVPSADIIFSADEEASVAVTDVAIVVPGDVFGPSAIAVETTRSEVEVVRPEIVDAYESPFIKAEIEPITVATVIPPVEVPAVEEVWVSVPPETVIAVAETPAVIDAPEIVEIAEPFELPDNLPAPVVEEVVEEPVVEPDELLPAVVAKVEELLKPAPRVRIVAGLGAEVAVVELPEFVEEEIIEEAVAVAKAPVVVVAPVAPVVDVAEQSVVTKPVLEEPAPIDVASIEPIAALVDVPMLVAPIPMPASMRPEEPVRVSVAVVSAPEELRHVPFEDAAFEGNVRTRINRLRTSRRVNIPLFDNDEYWGDGVETSNDERLEDFNLGEFSQQDYDNENGFNLQWARGARLPGFRRSGSFEEQIPPVHGDGIRMDLLQ